MDRSGERDYLQDLDSLPIRDALKKRITISGTTRSLSFRYEGRHWFYTPQ